MLNTHGIKMIGIRKAAGETKSLRGYYSGEYVELFYDRADGSVLTAERCAYRPFEPRSYAYISDSSPFPELSRWLSGVSVLYHEATYLASLGEQASQRHHSTTLQAARTALEAGAKKLLIGHYSSREKDITLYEKECRSIFPETFAANEGDRFDIV